MASGSADPPLGSCKQCGAPEKRHKVLDRTYTNLALGGYCADCINRAFTELEDEPPKPEDGERP